MSKFLYRRERYIALYRISTAISFLIKKGTGAGFYRKKISPGGSTRGPPGNIRQNFAETETFVSVVLVVSVVSVVSVRLQPPSGFNHHVRLLSSPKCDECSGPVSVACERARALKRGGHSCVAAGRLKMRSSVWLQSSPSTVSATVVWLEKMIWRIGAHTRGAAGFIT